ncbi:MAG: DUF3786 domain-containing protein [Desulfobacterales bacterium]
MAADGNYAKIVADNLGRLFENPPGDLDRRLGARRDNDRYHFPAFGRPCTLSADEIRLQGRPETGVLGILISLYALHAKSEPCTVEPLVSFKELPDSMPYAGAFVTRTQQVLVPRVDRICDCAESIVKTIGGGAVPPQIAGDVSFLLYPLPKIALCYVFYRADDDFPASVSCLYSANAARHLTTDALADVGEYTSREILQIIDR